MTTYLIRHRTSYHYAAEAVDSQNLSCLIPASFPSQHVLDWKLDITPKPDWASHWHDVFGNRRDAFSLATTHDKLDIEMFVKVERALPAALSLDCPWEAVVLPKGIRWQTAPPLLREYKCESPLIPHQDKAGFDVEDCFEPSLSVDIALTRFMERVYDYFEYDPKATDTFTPLEEVYEKKAGVCQDFAHAAIAELRRRGFSAGYVSGYLETVPLPGQVKLRGADATHAWYAVFLPGVGWKHFDPTNNVVPGTQHIITGWGRDYSDVAPVKGVVLGGGEHKVQVEVDVWRWPEQVPEEYLTTFD